LLAVSSAHPQQDEKKAADETSEAQAAKKLQAYAKEAAAAYEIHVRAAGEKGKGEGRRTLLRDEPILRWTNPVGGRRAHGEVFLWTDEGRPAAVLSLYQWTAPDGVIHEHHEFCSLATGAVATKGPGGRDWSPTEAGVTLLPVPEAPVPGASQRQRLSQMRELAGRFTAKKTTRNNETRALRLLPQPVHRFDSERGATDGALFAFVEATDPEAFLLLEVHTPGGKPQWHYAFARMTIVRIAASLGDKEVFLAEEIPWARTLNRKDQPYTAFTIK
jgi:hypothetical protein